MPKAKITRNKAAPRATEPCQAEIPDELGDALVAHGFASHRSVLNINGTLSVPDGFDMPPPWNLPSRMFRFPVEVRPPSRANPRIIGLMHPLLADHPFVLKVEATLGIELNRAGAPNEFGYSKTRLATYWHAVDLVSVGRWQTMLDTRRFTTSCDMVMAVSYGLRYCGTRRRRHSPHLTSHDARQVMAAVGAPQPNDWRSLLSVFLTPASVTSEETTRWPINCLGSEAAAAAWGMIVGVEEGWFSYSRNGFLEWTQAGRDRHLANAQHAADALPITDDDADNERRAIGSDQSRLKPCNVGKRDAEVLPDKTGQLSMFGLF